MRYISILLTIAITNAYAGEPVADLSHVALGTWEISEINYCPNVCALDDEQASSFNGDIIEFGEFSAAIGDETCDAPSYLYRHVTSSEFLQGNRFRLSDIGIDGDTVVEVSLFCGGPYGERKYGMASSFYIKNNNEIVVGYNGVEFLAKRVK